MRHPGLKDEIWADGDFKHYVNVYLNGDEVRALDNFPPMGEYSPEELAGPGGLLQTPNNNSREPASNSEGAEPQ